MLEQQKQESYRQLQNAKHKRQTKEKALASLESQLHELIYSNGQKRANLDRMRQLLNEGQRALGSAQADEKKSRRDFQELERVIRLNIETKRTMMAWERRSERTHDAMAIKTERYDQLSIKARDNVYSLECMRTNAMNELDALEAACRHEQLKSQQIHQETVAIRAESLACESEIEQYNRSSAAKHQELQELERLMAEEDAAHELAMAALDKELESRNSELSATRQAKQAKQVELDQVKSSVQETWKKFVEIQQAEGHATSPHPFTTNEATLLDLKSIAATVKAEALAAAEEEAAKDKIQAEVDELTKELLECKAQIDEKNKIAAELKQSCQKQLQKEAERQQSWNTFLKSFEIATKEADQCRQVLEQTRIKRDDELKDARDKAGTVKYSLKECQEATDAVERQLLSIESMLEGEQTELDALKLNHESASLAEVQSELLKVEQMIADLQAEKEHLEAGEPLEIASEIAAISMSESKMKAKQADYINGKHGWPVGIVAPTMPLVD